MKITVVIPVINLWSQYTENCINSLAKQKLPKDCYLEFIVIDNGSTDETCSKVEGCSEAGFPIKLIKNQRNIGVAASWNLGIKKAQGSDYIFVVNNDTLFEENCISELVSKLISEDLILVSPSEDGQDSTGGNYSAFLIDNKFLETMGEFDEKFYLAYFEDNDMEYRILLDGKKDMKCGKAHFKHFGSKTQNQRTGGIVPSPVFERNRNYYIEKWGGLPGQEKFLTPFNL
jgi:GT2 family glycosyltransferase